MVYTRSIAFRQQLFTELLHIHTQTATKRKRTADESIAFGTYAGGTEAGSQYTYRVKKSGAYGGYAIIKEVRLTVVTVQY